MTATVQPVEVVTPPSDLLERLDPEPAEVLAEILAPLTAEPL